MSRTFKICFSQPEMISITLEFSGGMELLFNNQKTLNLEIKPEQSMSDLIDHIAKKVITERVELFQCGNTVRPGVLVLVNDTDWELLGQHEYIVQNNDVIVFISTLHGG
jgi:ubiquitin related modifier 1